ncbi:conjugative transfer protein [Pseudoxanthomonas yeongjuensis]|uniref:virB8 family protein n=1 Tax=Pseudoxanthomonas yeongjuensis TaxID=377616 RepID=UPI001390F84D|nr:type IV secretion system protein [Pseudoxanthomonas yeongjuensis]KAF1716020.1 conjugative transfer protein [Pseudoxanthomonas yeongjuensis]
MFRKKESTPQIDKAVAKSVSFELTIADIARQSERRAWFVAFGAILLSLILAAGYFYMLPLKEKVPYLVMADAYTGTSTVARLNENFDNRSITTSEAINRSNVAHFLMARESYDVALMLLRDWTTVYTMSSPQVASGYTTLHARNNMSSPYNTYGKERAIRVNILSTVLIGGEDGGPPKGATVRFQRSLYDKKTGSSQPLDSKIATLEFSYKPNLKMDEKDRIENPLGFQVTSYRVDNDYAASPPVQTVLPQAPVAAMQESGIPGAQVPAGAPASGTLAPESDSAAPAQAAPPEGAAAPVTAPAPTNSVNGASNR